MQQGKGVVRFRPCIDIHKVPLCLNLCLQPRAALSFREQASQLLVSEGVAICNKQANKRIGLAIAGESETDSGIHIAGLAAT